MKYDDAEYCALNFETDLDFEAGGTHAGMYLAWAARRGFLGRSFETPTAQIEVARLLARDISGRQLYFSQCDGKLTDDDLNTEGNAFTAWYYEKQFVVDYRLVFQREIPDTGHATDDFCSVADNWANADRLARALDQRYERWKTRATAPCAAGASGADSCGRFPGMHPGPALGRSALPAGLIPKSAFELSLIPVVGAPCLG